MKLKNDSQYRLSVNIGKTFKRFSESGSGIMFMRYMPPLWACTNTIFIYYLIFRGKMWFLFALFSRNVNVQTARNGIKLMDHHHVKTKQILENLQSFITKICEILCEAEIFEKKQCARAHTNSRKHKVSHRYFHWFFFFV